MKADDLRQISSDNISAERVDEAMKIIESNMLAAANKGHRSCSVIVSSEMSEKVYERLERDGYSMLPTKFRNMIKLTIKW